MFDDPTEIVVKYLNSSDLGGVEAFGRVPAVRPDRFIRCAWTGSHRTSPMHRSAQVTVECWAPTAIKADRLGAAVEEALIALQDPWAYVPIGPEGWVGGPYPLPDPDSGTPRSVMTVILKQRSK